MSWLRTCSALAFASALWLVIASAPTAGCSNCSTGGQEPIEYSQGDTTGTSYETSPPDGVWLDFPAGRRFRLAHGLGTDRLSVHGYLSFSERPFSGTDAGSGNASEASGNALVIEAENDRYVQVRNDSCAEYYLRVVIQRQ